MSETAKTFDLRSETRDESINRLKGDWTAETKASATVNYGKTVRV